MAKETALFAELKRIVGPDDVVTDPRDKRLFEIDHTGRFEGVTPAVVLPGSEQEVAHVLAYCSAAGVAVVPQGGNTGLVAGATPMDGQVVLSLRRLAAVSLEGDRVICGAGTTLSQAQAAAASGGREIPIDIASRASATFGGMVATDAGGARSFRRGRMGDLVEDLRVALASGEIVGDEEARRVAVGMEGTLGVVVGGRLRSIQSPAPIVTALVGFRSLAELLAVARDLSRRFGTLEVIEYMGAPELDLVRRVLELPELTSPSGPFFLLLEWLGEDIDPIAADLREMHDTAVASSEQQRKLFWDYRDLINEALRRAGPPLKIDVTIPPEVLGTVLVSLHKRLPGRRVHAFGHLLAGHIHLNVLDIAREEMGDVTGVVLRTVLEAGGRIRGEHGVGRVKSPWLGLEGRPDEIARFLELKERYDPSGILNPGVVVPIYASG